jgi:hypothetical protein
MLGQVVLVSRRCFWSVVCLSGEDKRKCRDNGSSIMMFIDMHLEEDGAVRMLEWICVAAPNSWA